ncbi:MAG: hypothetical protein MI922_00750 [Bacteroidales bacterium]|nr:hypothetical protein [Bacteroidales bacterium]
MLAKHFNTDNTIKIYTKHKANNKITKLIDQINTNQVMYLINAIYLKGNWNIHFKEDNSPRLIYQTKPQQYHG